MSSCEFYIPLEYNFSRNTTLFSNHKKCEKCYSNILETLPNHTHEAIYLYRYEKLNVGEAHNIRKRINTNYILTTNKKDVKRLKITFTKNFDLYHWLTVLDKYVNIYTDLLKLDIVLVGQRHRNENGIYKITKNTSELHNKIFVNENNQMILPLIKSITFLY